MDGTEHNIDASTIAHWIVPNSNHNHIVLLGTVVGDVSRLSSASSSWEGGIHTYIHTHKRAHQHHVYRFGVTNGTSKIETSQWVWESWEIWKILLAVPTALQTHKTCSESWTTAKMDKLEPLKLVKIVSCQTKNAHYKGLRGFSDLKKKSTENVFFFRKQGSIIVVEQSSIYYW